MVVGIEDSHQVPDQAIVPEHNAIVGHDRATSVDEDTLAEHERGILARPQLDWYRLTAQKQAPARDGPFGQEYGAPPIDCHERRSRSSHAKCGCGPEAVGHVTNLNH